jgi:flagellar protein FlbT
MNFGICIPNPFTDCLRFQPRRVEFVNPVRLVSATLSAMGAASKWRAFMPLKISLKPGEKFVLNGAVVANGERRASLVLQNKATILREKDILQADEVNTPCKRIYFPVMMMYLDPENVSSYYEEFALRMTEFMGVVTNGDALKLCVSASKDVMAGRYYQALMTCRKLFEYEEERLSHVPSGVSADTEDNRESA